MIPWVRDRWVESRARWQNRKQRNNLTGNDELIEQKLATTTTSNRYISQDSAASPSSHGKRLVNPKYCV